MQWKNDKFGKIVNGNIVFAPNKLPSTGKDNTGNDVSLNVYNPSDYLYRLCGYLPIVYEAVPDDASQKVYEPEYIEENGTIYRRWREIEAQPISPTLEEQVEANAEAIMELAELIGGML